MPEVHIRRNRLILGQPHLFVIGVIRADDVQMKWQVKKKIYKMRIYTDKNDVLKGSGDWHKKMKFVRMCRFKALKTAREADLGTFAT